MNLLYFNFIFASFGDRGGRPRLPLPAAAPLAFSLLFFASLFAAFAADAAAAAPAPAAAAAAPAPAAAAAAPAAPAAAPAAAAAAPEGGAEEEHAEAGEGLYEYRKVGTELVDLWRTYTSMGEALNHLLRDYNVALLQQQKVEVSGILAAKHKAAAAAAAKAAAAAAPAAAAASGSLRRRAALQKEREKQQRKQALLLLLHAEATQLKELKQQIKKIDERVGKLPPYSSAAANIALIRSGAAAAVNVAQALNSSAAALFHRALQQYVGLLQQFSSKQKELFLLIQKIKQNAFDQRERLSLIENEALFDRAFDTDASMAFNLAGKLQ
ncbi:hypothetical protein, conserved [Eimeria tenella]|uniref:Uncharacterized protein n=1 Tax=Eimeria tenella TaxID=5802 RepID=U6KV12_EIMTE|nr:hypothetical protein, conserved [Eimeria tenella]CDJ39345.1 hypothetical protein, conserved [Eimeria tenella]|eukprot:XP_013230100.1 hypothetical protein, conserved [Eimeria tenella]